MADVTEQIMREAPDIEAYKIGLLESAKKISRPTSHYTRATNSRF
jgi:hypothetical protein